MKIDLVSQNGKKTYFFLFLVYVSSFKTSGQLKYQISYHVGKGVTLMK